MSDELFHSRLLTARLSRVQTKRGALTHTPFQALACLPRSAFGTPLAGRASNAILGLKLPVSEWTAAKLRELFLLTGSCS
jgi:hypothetical protein